MTETSLTILPDGENENRCNASVPIAAHLWFYYVNDPKLNTGPCNQQHAVSHGTFVPGHIFF